MPTPPASPTLASMTGFARVDGAADRLAWAWELRSVNGRGLDLRFRLPPGWDALEPALREAAGRTLKRGNVTANLTVKREETHHLAVDQAALDHMLELAMSVAARIPGAEPPRAEALLALPGVLRTGAAVDETDAAEAQAAIRAGFAAALAALDLGRHAEGARLGTVLAGMLDEIAALRASAGAQAATQPAEQQARLIETLRGLQAEAVDPARIAQEVALLASRSDVREELDRLASHVEAARALLAEGTGVGRRLEFLVQEFNREANTLCSKSASIPLTGTGLRLKAAIEQLREQAANIE